MLRIVPEIRLSTHLARLRALASRFKSDRRGNVAVITAIAALPMISAIGCVIDYSNASMIRTKLQAAADAASLATVSNNSPVLATAKAMGSNGSVSGGSTYASNFFTANLPSAYSGLTPTVSVTKTGTTVTATVSFSTTVPTYFMGIVGYPNITISDSSTASYTLLLIPQFLPDDRRLRVHEFPFDAVGADEIDGRQSRQSRAISQRLPVRLSFYRAERLRPV